MSEIYTPRPRNRFEEKEMKNEVPLEQGPLEPPPPASNSIIPPNAGTNANDDTENVATPSQRRLGQMSSLGKSSMQGDVSTQSNDSATPAADTTNAD